MIRTASVCFILVIVSIASELAVSRSSCKEVNTVHGGQSDCKRPR